MSVKKSAKKGAKKSIKKSVKKEPAVSPEAELQTLTASAFTPGTASAGSRNATSRCESDHRFPPPMR